MPRSDTTCLLIDHFSVIPDPRHDMNKKHLLIDIVVMAVCGAIAGADGWNDVEQFACAREDWLRGFLELPGGIPSHDTFRDVFMRLNPDAFGKAFMAWIGEVQARTVGGVVAIDGKSLRRALAGPSAKSPFHLVSAWASENGISLGQVKVSKKSNEIKAIPTLLDQLTIKGCIVTIDAMGTQTAIAEKIIEKKADYVLAVKANQPALHETVQEFFQIAQQEGFKDVDHETFQTVEKDHGRIETRTYYLSSELGCYGELRRWPKIGALGMVISDRRIGEKVTTDTRYFITSMKRGVQSFSNAVRQHWGIENNLHWVLDVAFDEDQCRKRSANSAENYAIVRKTALNLLRMDKTTKGSIRGKRYAATLDTGVLERILFQ